MAEFKKGDVVIGNKGANRYGITTEGWIGDVIGVKGSSIHVRKHGSKPSTSDRDAWWVEASNFDLYDVANKKRVAKPISDKPTRGEVYEAIFGCPHPGCPTPSCEDCPCREGCASQKWWGEEYTGDTKVAFGVSRVAPRNKEHVPTKKKGLKGLCEEYNYSDSAGLEYIMNNDLCTTPEQKTSLDILNLLNELLFTYNSEKHRELEYRAKYKALLASLGVSLDREGFAYIKEKKEGDM